MVRQAEPRVELLDMTLNFIHQTAAMVGWVKQWIPSKERSSVRRAIMQSIIKPQIHANPEVLLNTAVYLRLN